MPLLNCWPQDHVPADAGERRLGTRLQRRHLDDEVVVRVRPAGEPPPVCELIRRERARVEVRDAEGAAADGHLAFLAGAVAAARRVDGDAVPARRVEHGRPARYACLAERAGFRPGVQEAQETPSGSGLVLLRFLDTGSEARTLGET